MPARLKFLIGFSLLLLLVVPSGCAQQEPPPAAAPSVEEPKGPAWPPIVILSGPVKNPRHNYGHLLATWKLDELEAEFDRHAADPSRDAYGRAPVELAFRELEDRTNMIHAMEDWTKAHPDSVHAWTALGRTLVEHAWEARGGGRISTVTPDMRKTFLTRLTKAKIALEKAVALEPTSPFANQELITLAMGMELDFDKMEARFRKAVEGDPEYYTAYYAKLNYLMPKWHGSALAMMQFAALSAQSPKPGSMLPLLVIQAHQEASTFGENPVAYWKQPAAWEVFDQTYSKLLADNPERHYTRNVYAYFALVTGNWDVAAREIEIIGAHWSPEIWKELPRFLDGMACAAAKREDARYDTQTLQWFVGACEKQLAANTAQPEVWLSLGRAHLLAGDAVAAEAAWQNGLNENPVDIEYRVELAKIYGRELKKSDKAVEIADAVLNLKTTDDLALHDLGVLLMELEQIPAAERVYEYAQSIEPEWLFNYTKLIQHYDVGRENEKLLAQVEKAMAHSSRMPTEHVAYLRFLRAGTNLRLKREKPAVEDLEYCLKHDPGDAELLNMYAWLLLTAEDTSMRNPKKALTLARNAVAITRREVPPVLDTLALAYEMNGQPGQAIQIYEEVLRLDPDEAHSAERLAALKKQQ